VAVKPVPDGFQSAIPALVVQEAAKAIEFYQIAFGAKEIMRMPDPKGNIVHAEIKIGNSLFMLSDEFPDMHAHSPNKYGGTPVSFYLYD
jgi:PhnB protein